MTTQTQQQPDLAAIMQEMLGIMKQNRVDDDLWTADEIATYCKLSKSTVQQRLLGKPDFPKPTVLPTAPDGERGGKRWFKNEVKAWAKRHR